MLPYPDIDPVLLQLGPLKIRWYGLMYVLGFIASYLLVKKQLREFGFRELQPHFENRLSLDLRQLELLHQVDFRRLRAF